MKTPAIFDTVNILKCKILSDAPSGRHDIKLTMDGGIHNICSVAVEIFAPSPNITAAQFSEGGSQIFLTFNTQVEAKKANGDLAKTCTEILNSSTIEKFGNNPVCTWSTTAKLTITLGSGAAIVPGDTIQVKGGIIKQLGEALSRAAQGSVKVSPPANPVRPVPVVSGTYECLFLYMRTYFLLSQSKILTLNVLIRSVSTRVLL